MADAEKRVRGIDLLRGLCIVAVVLHHTNLRIHFHDSAFGKWIGASANNVLFWNGYYGVRVFFVISGFLIAGWSLKRWGELGKINVRQFYAMRFARIIPCLIGLLALLAVLDRLAVPRFTIDPHHTSLARALVAALAFHINWLEARTGYLPAAWDILWSLSVEEVFYFFFPLLCAVFRKQALLIAVFAAFVVAGPFARVLTPPGLWVDYGYAGCMDGIALGCLAALLCAQMRFGPQTRRMFLASGIALAALITIFRGTAAHLQLWRVGLDVTVLNLGIALLLIALQQRFDSRSGIAVSRGVAPIPGGVLQWFGRNSYEVYLTHMLVVWPMVWLFALAHQPINLAPAWFIGILTIAGLLGYLVARYYSEPANRALRARFIGSRQSGAVPPPITALTADERG